MKKYILYRFFFLYLACIYSMLAPLFPYKGTIYLDDKFTGCDKPIPQEWKESLQYSIYHRCMNWVIDQVNSGLDINQFDDSHMTPLLRAIYDRKYEIAKYLIEQGADPSLQGKRPVQYTPMTLAVMRGQEEIFDMLLYHGADINLVDGHNESPLTRAISNDDYNFVVKLIRLGADVNSSETFLPPIHFACTTNIYNELVRAGADVYQETIIDDSILFSTISFCDSNEVLINLMKFSLDVNYQDSFGETPLMEASSSNKLYMIKTLIEYGADASIRDNEGRTAYDHAKRYDHTEIVEYFESIGVHE